MLRKLLARPTAFRADDANFAKALPIHDYDISNDFVKLYRVARQLLKKMHE